MGIAGFILGICSIVFCWIPFLNVVLSILGLVFSIIGLKRDKKVFAIIGLITAILGVIIGTIVVIAVLSEPYLYY